MIQLQLLTCNVHATSDPTVVSEWLEKRVAYRGIDIVTLQELTKGHRQAIAFRSALARSGTLYFENFRPGAADTGVWVRDGLKVVDHRTVPMGRATWWGHKAKREHAPRSMATATLNFGLTVASVHTPPGVNCLPFGLTGPKDRQRAWKAYMRHYRKWAMYQVDDFVAAGDWNEHARVRAPWSPRRIAGDLGDTPAYLTSGGTIDYPMSRGVEVSFVGDVGRAPGMDHEAMLYRIDVAGV